MLATIEKRENTTLVRITADTLDAGNEKRFRKEVISRLEPEANVVLDLDEVDFIDSSGLGAILSCYRHLQTGKGDLKLCRMNDAVRSLFELVRMHRIFEIFESPEAAIDSFKQ
jgi:anti-sigma B factor antagonist